MKPSVQSEKDKNVFLIECIGDERFTHLQKQ